MKQSKNKNVKNDRAAGIVKTSLVGIIVNVLLSAFKAVVGWLSGSIAIILDAANNLSDAASSIITIIGAKFAGKRADKNHPFGHGRIEYVSSMAIGLIILYAGGMLLIESIKKIFNPKTPEYTIATLITVVAAIIVKILLGLFVSAKGKKLDSQSLRNSGKDALFDAVISVSILITIIVFKFTGLSLEAYLAVAISLFIIRSGIEMLREAVSSVLGERPDEKIVRKIIHHIEGMEDVYGAFDLVLNNYGPDMLIGSINIEVNDTMQASEIDVLSRKISNEIYKNYNVVISSIGIYARNTKDEEIIKKRKKLVKDVMNIQHVMQIHGVYVNQKQKTLRFDVVVSFEEENPARLYARVMKEAKRIFPDYDIELVLDSDYALV